MRSFYMVIGAVALTFITVMVMIIVTYGGIEISTRRVENAMVSAGWSVFSEIDLDKVAERLDESSEEEREIYLYKNIAKEKIKEYIKKNLKLDNSYYATKESFINLKNYPVVIEDITVYNPDELPTIAPNGKEITRTSVYIKLQFPIKVKFVGDSFKEVEVIVDTETFYSILQKERM